MPNINYLGENCGLITRLGFSGYGEARLVEFLKDSKELKFKYLIAITANHYQKAARLVLKRSGFTELKEHIFYSAHNDKTETLSIWFKIQKNKKKPNNAEIADLIGNCSVSTCRDGSKQCVITIKGKEDTVKSLTEKKFQAIDKTPIWFKIAPHNIVDEKQLKKLKLWSKPEKLNKEVIEIEIKAKGKKTSNKTIQPART